MDGNINLTFLFTFFVKPNNKVFNRQIGISNYVLNRVEVSFYVPMVENFVVSLRSSVEFRKP